MATTSGLNIIIVVLTAVLLLRFRRKCITRSRKYFSSLCRVSFKFMSMILLIGFHFIHFILENESVIFHGKIMSGMNKVYMYKFNRCMYMLMTRTITIYSRFLNFENHLRLSNILF